jgi:hypothetical protein
MRTRPRRLSDEIARHGDDAFDDQLIRARWRAEDDHVAALGLERSSA